MAKENGHGINVQGKNGHGINGQENMAIGKMLKWRLQSIINERKLNIEAFSYK